MITLEHELAKQQEHHGEECVAAVLTEHGPFEIIGETFAFFLGGVVCVSSAYGLWGRLHIVIDDDDWCVVTWRLGRYSRTKRFPRPAVRSVRMLEPDPMEMFPSRSGKQLELDIDRERRPLLLGGGFDIDADALQAIAKLFAEHPESLHPPPPPPPH